MTKKQLILAYAQFGCASVYIKRHCRGLDWRYLPYKKRI